MKFQAFHVNPGEKLKKKDVNNDLSNFMSVFPIVHKFSVLRIALFTKKISKNVQIHLTSKTQFSLNAIRKV